MSTKLSGLESKEHACDELCIAGYVEITLPFISED